MFLINVWIPNYLNINSMRIWALFIYYYDLAFCFRKQKYTRFNAKLHHIATNF